VYADQQIHELIEKVETLKETTSLPNISNIVNNISKTNIVNYTPKYRGVYYEAGTIDENGNGVIGGDIINIGDWVAYLGLGTAQEDWEPTYCYRLIDSGWEKIPITETAPYMAALADITSGATNGVFNALFVKSVFSQTVNTELVNIAIKLLAGTEKEGIEIDGKNGIIQSRNYKQNISGFMIRKNKQDNIQSEFTDIKVRNMEVTGNLNANVSMFGKDAFPLTGAVREYIVFQTVGENVNVWDTSKNISGIARTSTGQYSILFENNMYVHELDRIAVIGSGNKYYNGALTGLIVLKTLGFSYPKMGYWVTEFQIEIRTPDGKFVDPDLMNVMLIG
jgi:hypothetical protein